MRKSLLVSVALIFSTFSANLSAQAPHFNLNSTSLLTVQPSGDDAVLVRLEAGSTNNISFQVLDGATGKLLGQVEANGLNNGKGQMTQVKTILKARVGQELVLRLREQGVPGGIRIRLLVDATPRNLMVQRQADSSIFANGTSAQPMNDACHGYMVLSDNCTLIANCKGEPLFNLVTCTVVECDAC